MKRSIAAVILIIFILIPVFAYQNIYNADSLEYRLLSALSRLSVTELPNPTSGVSGDQMENLMDSLDMEGLNASELLLFEELCERVERPPMMLKYPSGIGLNGRAVLSPQAFVSTNKEATSLDWDRYNQNRKGFASFGADMYFGEFSFGTVDIDMLKDFDSYCFHGFEVNIGESWDAYKPYKALASIGKGMLNFELGRDRIYYSKGRTGSMGLGDNFVFSNFAKISATSHPLSYDLTLLAYDSNSKDAEGNALETSLTKFDFNSPSQYLFIHRISYTPFRFMNIAVYEGMLVYGVGAFQDPRTLNPFMILHNLMTYDNGNANNYFGFELDLIPYKGFEVHLEAMLDQIQLKGESQGDGTTQLSPNAYGVLANVSYTTVHGTGILELYLEGAYTSPALYLKEPKTHSKFDPDGVYDNHDVDLIVGSSMGTDSANYSYLGYRYGCDTIAAGLGAAWFDLTGMEFGFDALFTAHGLQGIDYRGDGLQMSHIQTGKEHYNDVSPTKDISNGLVPEYRIAVSACATVPILSGLEASGSLSVVNAWNHLNMKGSSFFDVQLTLSFRIEAIELGIEAAKSLF